VFTCTLKAEFGLISRPVIDHRCKFEVNGGSIVDFSLVGSKILLTGIKSRREDTPTACVLALTVILLKLL
jgi:hypothetical protein